MWSQVAAAFRDKEWPLFGGVARYAPAVTAGALTIIVYTVWGGSVLPWSEFAVAAVMGLLFVWLSYRCWASHPGREYLVLAFLFGFRLRNFVHPYAGFSAALEVQFISTILLTYFLTISMLRPRQGSSEEAG